MVRRPLLWFLGSFVLGSLLYQVPMVVFLLGGGILLLLISLFLIRQSKNRHDMVLLCMPIFFFLGNLLMQNGQLAGPMDSILIGEEPLVVTVTGQIRSIQSSKKSYKILLEQVQYEETEDTSACILIYTEEVSGLSIGNEIEATGELSRFPRATNAYQFDQAAYYKMQNIDYRLYASNIQKRGEKVSFFAEHLYRLRRRCLQVFDTIADEEVASSLSAMVLGEKSLLESDTKEIYQVGGIAHIISISGLHIALLGMSLFSLLQRSIGLKVAVVATILFVIAYGILTNFSVSTNRAVLMLVLLLVAKLVGRTYDLLSAVALSGLFILIREPMQVYQAGFLFSYGAVLGISVVYPCMMGVVDEEWLKNGRIWKEEQAGFIRGQLYKKVRHLRYRTVRTLLMQAAIFFTTLPAVAWFYYKTPLYSFFVNLLVLPFVSLIILFGLLGAMVGMISLPLGQLLLVPAILILQLDLKLCRFIGTLPAHYVVLGKPQMGTAVLYMVLLIVACVLMVRKYRSGMLCLAAAVCLLGMPRPRTGLTITSLDVGQGDCYLLQAPEGTYLMDAGSTTEKEVGKYRILPYLYGSGITTIDLVFASHGDEDHVSGIYELLTAVSHKELRIGKLVLPDTRYQDASLQKLAKAGKEAGVEVVCMEQGWMVQDGELAITCLHPAREYVASDANGYSLVLSLRYGAFSMLFTGDLTSEAEKALLEEGLSKHDVLKVAHHGSKYSSSKAFLERVAPSDALISSGRKNRYGHPHKEAVERLKEVGSRIWNTKEGGMLTIQVEKEGRSYTIAPYAIKNACPCF